jgi:hypothetical protein
MTQSDWLIGKSYCFNIMFQLVARWRVAACYFFSNIKGLIDDWAGKYGFVG